jgi:hypothetical protein
LALSIVDPENSDRYLEVRGSVERIDPDPGWAFINWIATRSASQMTSGASSSFGPNAPHPGVNDDCHGDAPRRT